jgi:CRISPR/Cas system-associated protein Csm6
LAIRWQTALSQLETLKPPSNLAAPLNTLSDAANRAEADLTAITAAAATHSSSAAKQASASLVTDILSAKSASTTITQKLGIQ